MSDTVLLAAPDIKTNTDEDVLDVEAEMEWLGKLGELLDGSCYVEVDERDEPPPRSRRSSRSRQAEAPAFSRRLDSAPNDIIVR